MTSGDDKIIDDTDLALDAEPFITPEEALNYLRDIGRTVTPDTADTLDIGEAALALGLVFLSGINPARYREHLRKLARMTAELAAQRIKSATEDTVDTRADILRQVIHQQLGYKGDVETYNDIQNANIIRVIERRRGLPVALGILYIAAATAQGWEIAGLNFPGHFLLRLEKDGARIIIDPFNEGRVMSAADLRVLLKSIVGTRAELSHRYYDTVSRRDVLVRLQNNLKSRLIDREEYGEAIVVAETIEALDPSEFRILFDKGILYARIGETAQAIKALEDYLGRNPPARDRDEATAVLAHLKKQLH